MSRTPPPDDAGLVASVRALNGVEVDPATVEQRVGRPALVNTDTGLPLAALRRVSLTPDAEHPDEVLDLDSARTVVYWARPVEADNPRVVGVQVGADGAARAFFAVVLPPG
jgi:hypothetical protein